MGYPLNSTHFKHWIIPKAELAERRRQVYEESLANLQAKLKLLDCPPESVALPSFEETIELVEYYLSQLLFVCNEKKLDYRLTVTAGTFLSRFYLKKCVINFDPRKILLTCILLAAKVEEVGISVKTFCDDVISSREKFLEILSYELKVLESINFQLVILNARGPLHYLTTEYFREYENKEPDLEKNVTLLNQEAEQLALQALFNDIQFLFTPSQIAVAAFLHVGSKRVQSSYAFISQLLQSKKMSESLEVVQQTRKELALLLEKQKPAEVLAPKALSILKKIDKANKLVLKGLKEKKVKTKSIKVKSESESLKTEDEIQMPCLKKLHVEVKSEKNDEDS